MPFAGVTAARRTIAQQRVVAHRENHQLGDAVPSLRDVLRHRAIAIQASATTRHQSYTVAASRHREYGARSHARSTPRAISPPAESPRRRRTGRAPAASAPRTPRGPPPGTARVRPGPPRPRQDRRHPRQQPPPRVFVPRRRQRPARRPDVERRDVPVPHALLVHGGAGDLWRGKADSIRRGVGGNVISAS